MIAEQKIQPEEGLDTFAIKWCRVVSRRRETPDTYTLKIKPLNGSVNYSPGQFSMLYRYGVGEAPISFSGDSDNGKQVEHTLRAVGGVTRALASAQPGDTVGMRGPFGNGWPLKEAEGHDVVVVAGGIGLAPLRPLIRHFLRSREKIGKLYILYGARSPGELVYKRELQAWKKRLGARLLITVDKGDEKWRGHIGVVTTLFKYVTLDPENTYAYICGPEIMMRFTIAELKKQGLGDDRIFISMERNMKCGVGLCGHCQFGPYFVCKDGPVFSYSEVSHLFGRREI